MHSSRRVVQSILWYVLCPGIAHIAKLLDYVETKRDIWMVMDRSGMLAGQLAGQMIVSSTFGSSDTDEANKASSRCLRSEANRHRRVHNEAVFVLIPSRLVTVDCCHLPFGLAGCLRVSTSHLFRLVLSSQPGTLGGHTAFAFAGGCFACSGGPKTE